MSCVNTIADYLSRFTSDFKVTNSAHFASNLSSEMIQGNETIMVFLDVESLFTNIPMDGVV